MPSKPPPPAPEPVGRLAPRRRVFVALDTPSAERALELSRVLQGRVGGYKVGLELFTSGGPDIVRELAATGVEVFVDLKLHDIPNTVRGAAAAVAELGASWLTVHASGGARMMAAAVEAAHERATRLGRKPPGVLAVTVLTSHDDAELAGIGLAGPCGDAVLRLTGLAREAQVAGIVCSSLEVTAVRRHFPEATLFVPGIRPAAETAAGRAAGDDQRRIATPRDAVAAGADRLVIGRPITRAPDPRAAAAAIVAELESAAPP